MHSSVVSGKGAGFGGYISSTNPVTLLLPSLMSRTVSMDVKHYVYLLFTLLFVED